MEHETSSAPKRRPGRPATGQTPVRTARLGDVWDRCAKLADARGEKMTALVERALLAEERRLLRRGRQTEGATS